MKLIPILISLIISAALSPQCAAKPTGPYIDCKYGKITVNDDCFFLNTFLPFITGSDSCLQDKDIAEHDDIFFKIVDLADGSVSEVLFNYLVDAIKNHPGFVSRAVMSDKKMQAINEIVDGEAIMSGVESKAGIQNFKKKFISNVKPYLTADEYTILETTLSLIEK